MILEATKLLKKTQMQNYKLVSNISEIKDEFYIIKGYCMTAFHDLKNYTSARKDLKDRIKLNEVYILK